VALRPRETQGREVPGLSSLTIPSDLCIKINGLNIPSP
jgi:hypothetical protein